MRPPHCSRDLPACLGRPSAPGRSTLAPSPPGCRIEAGLALRCLRKVADSTACGRAGTTAVVISFVAPALFWEKFVGFMYPWHHPRKLFCQVRPLLAPYAPAQAQPRPRPRPSLGAAPRRSSSPRYHLAITPPGAFPRFIITELSPPRYYLSSTPSFTPSYHPPRRSSSSRRS